MKRNQRKNKEIKVRSIVSRLALIFCSSLCMLVLCSSAQHVVRNKFAVKQAIGKIYFLGYSRIPKEIKTDCIYVVKGATSANNVATLYSHEKLGIVPKTRYSKIDVWDIDAEIVYIQNVNGRKDTVAFSLDGAMEINRVNMELDSAVFNEVVKYLPYWAGKHIYKNGS